MLPAILRQRSSCFRNDSEWRSYLNSIGTFSISIEHDFLSSICYEHFDRFNSYFPKFDIRKHKVERITFSADKIYNEIRYDDNKRLDFWYFQADDYINSKSKLSYPELAYCMKNRKWSFRPVIISNEFGTELGGCRLGRPFHLIEGTHRVSFINRLLELKKIDGNSTHELLIVKP